MYHSITLGTKNTWDDWHLIPKSRPLVNPPALKTIRLEVPGCDGTLDLTFDLSGRSPVAQAVGSWEFIVENGFKDWSFIYSEIIYHLQGKDMQATLEDDPEHYYYGRFAVNAWRSEKQFSTIVIDYQVSPFRIGK